MNVVDKEIGKLAERTTQDGIKEVLTGMKELLIDKNKKYGDSALNPLGVFTKHLANEDVNVQSILVRLDDKLMRVKNSDCLRTNDICDLIGYLTLLAIGKGVTKEDIEKLKD